MTKKDLILQKSLELFSTSGFKGTSTRSIAHEAGVSEGLIFKHFKSKNGLLNALLESALLNLHLKFKKLKITMTQKK